MLWYQFFAGVHKNDFTAKKFLNQSKEQKFYSSKYAASICFWKIKLGYIKISDKKNPCFPKYFLSYYSWRAFQLTQIDSKIPPLAQTIPLKKIDIIMSFCFLFCSQIKIKF